MTSVDNLLVKTGVKNEKGEVADPCKGDSGGPLLLRRKGNWEVVGTLKVGISSVYVWWVF